MKRSGLQSLQYAEDTQLCVSILSDVANDLNECLNETGTWIIGNGLVLNPYKTKVMLVDLKELLEDIPSIISA